MKYTLKDTLGNPIGWNLEYDNLAVGQTIRCQDDDAVVVYVGEDGATIRFWDGEKCVLRLDDEAKQQSVAEPVSGFAKKIFTVSNLNGVYGSQHGAMQAWDSAGCPRPVGSSVWITESYIDSAGCAHTLRTHTISN